MPNLTNKGIDAMRQIIKHYSVNENFSAKALSEKCGERYVAATLNALVGQGLLIKYPTSPIQYSIIPDVETVFENTLKENSPKKSGANNDNLHQALKNKDDEFYTYYSDVEAEIKNYISHFIGKSVFLNCNDADEGKSAFWDYFVNNFTVLQLKELVASSYNPDGGAILKSYDGTDIKIQTLNGTGSYRSEECLEVLDRIDIVVTNPPFSLFRDLVKLLVEKNKSFLLIGNENTFASTEMFPLIKDGKVWTGLNKVKDFKRQDEADRKFGNICWFTNLHNHKQNEKLNLTKVYSAENYPTYDNYYTAINVDAIADIPKDYKGIMGIPISYLGKYNPDQFEILGLAAGNSKANGLFYDVPHIDSPLERGGCGVINGVRKYSRVFVRRTDI
jgi:hypothetical protein